MMFSQPLGARFHAIYGDAELVVGIASLSIIQGDAPRAIRQMVLDWAAQHQHELLAGWQRCQSGLAPVPIAPLR